MKSMRYDDYISSKREEYIDRENFLDLAMVNEFGRTGLYCKKKYNSKDRVFSGEGADVILVLNDCEENGFSDKDDMVYWDCTIQQLILHIWKTNNPSGRPRKASSEKRKAVTYRLSLSSIEQIKKWSRLHGCSQSDEIMGMVDYFLQQ